MNQSAPPDDPAHLPAAFKVDTPDHTLSPHTGMTRDHWIQAAVYTLRRAFNHVADADALFEFPSLPGRSYPRPGAPAWEYRSKNLEGFRRTMSIAAPLLHVRPDLQIKGIPVADYYRRHITRLLTPGDPACIPMPEEIGDSYYQFTCELGGLTQILLHYPDQFWSGLDDSQRDAVAQTLSRWGHYRTQPCNWYFFNVMILTFLKKNGYAVDDAMLEGHLDQLLAMYGGQGWYDDWHYDYYTAWVFHMYSIVWNRAYGDAHDPGRVKIHEERFAAFMQSYPHLLGRDGHMLMWGRSICYRFAAACPFPLAFIADTSAGPSIDPGWARRLSSGTLLQFLSREDFWHQDIPSLGFYRHWEPLVQPYSSTASPLWMFLPFVALSLPEDSPFWTATENDGPWEKLGNRRVCLVMDDIGLHITNHGTSGTAELRPSDIRKPSIHYDRLVYNTAFPWEDEDPYGATAGSYALRCIKTSLLKADNAPFVTHGELLNKGTRGGVLYRRLQLKDPGHGRLSWIDLADIVVPFGVLRVDRLRICHEYELRLGHFGLPRLAEEEPKVQRYTRGGASALVVSGHYGSLAVVIYAGWAGLDTVTRNELNAVEPRSTLVYAHRQDQGASPPPELVVTAMLHRTDGQDWSEDELFFVDRIETKAHGLDGAVSPATIRLVSGDSFEVNHDPAASRPRFDGPTRSKP